MRLIASVRRYREISSYRKNDNCVRTRIIRRSRLVEGESFLLFRQLNPALVRRNLVSTSGLITARVLRNGGTIRRSVRLFAVSCSPRPPPPPPPSPPLAGGLAALVVNPRVGVSVSGSGGCSCRCRYAVPPTTIAAATPALPPAVATTNTITISVTVPCHPFLLSPRSRACMCLETPPLGVYVHTRLRRFRAAGGVLRLGVVRYARARTIPMGVRCRQCRHSSRKRRP